MPKKSVQKKGSSKKEELKKHLLFLCSCCSLILLLFLSSFNLNSFLVSKKVLGASVEASQNEELQRQKTYWENFLSGNPTYLDGWLELAQIELKLGDLGYALGALNTAKAINPNSEKVKEVEKNLNQ